MDEVATLHEVLDWYYQVSGQRLNNEKSSIYFGELCLVTTKKLVKHVLNIHNESLINKYLGSLWMLVVKRMEFFLTLKTASRSVFKDGWRSVLLGVGRKL